MMPRRSMSFRRAANLFPYLRSLILRGYSDLQGGLLRLVLQVSMLWRY